MTEENTLAIYHLTATVTFRSKLARSKKYTYLTREIWMLAYTDNLQELNRDKTRLERFRKMNFPKAEDFKVIKISNAKRIGGTRVKVAQNN